ncbi:hypothetical protein EF847_08765 [Actinobacteria bacterium YIM 96077]|uniref:ASCH domain-containing protein n=1 Tax=Phytoactinopolyspora halophila TaxID=1981511 RepID=A0A329QWS0_9ACTN|nr:hypothetical protein [Phytoactinopolyspora halophila]AYY12791.1 hypothetical protein EF847_08765 [Actinobacteria bacterium YIM 96077]RAW16416.1 hypothetical protein DPM12_07255 [Phytoactinopolyspora halophila]
MLFEKRFWAGIEDGSITLTFRRWKRRQAVAGRSYRTGAGIIDVLAVDIVDPASISDGDARAAGYPDAASLVYELRGDDTLPTYRIEFRRSDRSDPRAELARESELDHDERAEIDRRLDRLDQASRSGAWTRDTLRLIGEHPARRAGDLAAMMGRERDDFKADVRKLKNLGLTESLDIGYQLSPRGRAYLADPS